MREKLAFVLLEKILELVKSSGANRREASSALRAAEAMLSEIDLEAASLTIET
jgi:hypothetical protein